MIDTMDRYDGRHFADYGTASGLEEAVDLISIDEFFRTNHIYRLDVIKLDIEGAEYRALVGGSATIARFRPIVIFELNATMLTLNGSSAEDLRRFFWGSSISALWNLRRRTRLFVSHNPDRVGRQHELRRLPG